MGKDQSQDTQWFKLLYFVHKPVIFKIYPMLVCNWFLKNQVWKKVCILFDHRIIWPRDIWPQTFDHSKVLWHLTSDIWPPCVTFDRRTFDRNCQWWSNVRSPKSCSQMKKIIRCFKVFEQSLISKFHCVPPWKIWSPLYRSWGQRLSSSTWGCQNGVVLITVSMKLEAICDPCKMDHQKNYSKALGYAALTLRDPGFAVS